MNKENLKNELINRGYAVEDDCFKDAVYFKDLGFLHFYHPDHDKIDSVGWIGIDENLEIALHVPDWYLESAQLKSFEFKKYIDLVITHPPYKNTSRGNIMKTVDQYTLDLACLLYGKISDNGVEQVHQSLKGAAGYNDLNSESHEETYEILNTDVNDEFSKSWTYKDRIDLQYEYILTQAIPDGEIE